MWKWKCCNKTTRHWAFVQYFLMITAIRCCSNSTKAFQPVLCSCTVLKRGNMFHLIVECRADLWPLPLTDQSGQQHACHHLFHVYSVKWTGTTGSSLMCELGALSDGAEHRGLSLAGVSRRGPHLCTICSWMSLFKCFGKVKSWQACIMTQVMLCWAKSPGCIVICSLVNAAEWSPAEHSWALQCSGYMVNKIFRTTALVGPARCRYALTQWAINYLCERSCNKHLSGLLPFITWVCTAPFTAGFKLRRAALMTCCRVRNGLKSWAELT